MHLAKPFVGELDDPNVTEVVVNRPGQFGVERSGQWEWHDAPELTFDRMEQIGLAAAAETSKDFSRANPVCGTILPGGQRMQINRPPAVTPDDTITMCIRRPFHKNLTMDDDDLDDMTSEVNTGLSRKELALNEASRLFQDREWRGFLKHGIEHGFSIGVCADQGAGKTTSLNRFMTYIPSWRRIVTIEEDAPEFWRTGPTNRAGFLYANVGLERVMKAGLRMRADEVIFQEARGGEVYYLTQARLRGARIMTTWHAEFGREFEALASMYRMSEFGRSETPDEVQGKLKRLIDIVVWQYRDAREQKFRMARIWFRGMEETL
jgi:type IV secretion system protein VirB11